MSLLVMGDKIKQKRCPPLSSRLRLSAARIPDVSTRSSKKFARVSTGMGIRRWLFLDLTSIVFPWNPLKAKRANNLI